MMKKIIIIYSFIISGCSFLHAQTLDWSISEKLKIRPEQVEILGKIDESLFIIQYDKKSLQTFIFQRYDAQLRKSAQYEKTLEKQFHVVKIALHDKKLYFFYASYNKETKTYSLFADIFDHNFNEYDKGNLIIETKSKLDDNSTFQISFNKLTNKILIISSEGTSGKNTNLKLVILDHLLETLESLNVALPFEETMAVTNIEFAEPYITAIITRKGSSGILFKQNEQSFQFICINAETNALSQFNLYNDSLKLTNVIYKYDYFTTGYIITGYFSNHESTESKGLAFIKYFPSNDSSLFRFIYFSKEMAGVLSGSRPNMEGVMDFYPVYSVLRNDGGFIFVGEYYRIQKEVLSNPYSLNSNYIKYYYQFREIMIVSINPDGKVDWNKIIRKEQYSTNDEGVFSSFLAGATHENLFFIYNDMSRLKWNLILDKIDPNGKTEHKIIVNGNNFTAGFLPKSGMQISNHEFIIPLLEEKKGFSFLRLTF